MLKREGLSKIPVIAGGRIADGFVITPAVKAAVVARLQEIYQVYVWAFGDSVLDLDMLKRANRAIVVVGNEQIRSKTMDAALLRAIDKDGLQALQVGFPRNLSPRLNSTKLPIVHLTDNEFIDSMFSRLRQLRVFLATANAANLLATQMRDAAVFGPNLRKAHRLAGWYLAHEIVSSVIGLEECPISHVLGYGSNGYRLLHEQRTTIIALMRAGEPMASGSMMHFRLPGMFMLVVRPRSSSIMFKDNAKCCW